jgi:hypothetical protein
MGRITEPMDSDGEDNSIIWIGIRRMTSPHMNSDGEDDSTTWIRVGKMTAPHE